MRKKIIVKCKNVELPQHLVQPQSRSLTGNITDAQKFHNFSFWRRKKRHFPQTRFHARMVTKIISYSNLINEQKPFLYSTAVSVLVWISVFFFERRVSSTIMPIRLFLQEEVLCFFMSHPRLRKIYSWLFSCLFNLTENRPLSKHYRLPGATLMSVSVIAMSFLEKELPVHANFIQIGAAV